MPSTDCPTFTFELSKSVEHPSTEVEGHEPGTFVPVGATHFTTQIIDGGSDGTSTLVRYIFKDASGHWTGTATRSVSSGGTSTVSLSTAVPLGSVTFDFDFGTSGGTPMFVSVTAIIAFTGSCETCAFGTEPKPGVGATLIASAGIVDLVTLIMDLPWLGVIYSTFIGELIYTGSVCAGNPAPFPTFTACDLDPFCGLFNPANLDRFRAAWEIGLWYTYCQCKTGPGGSPPPTPPPLPSPSPPSPAPPPIVPISCDGGDLCNVINHLQQMLDAMNRNIANVTAMVTLIQRQKVPFAYVRGAPTAGLTGNGQLAVQGILGCSVNITGAPSYLGSDMDPTARSTYFFGWLNLGTPDGWLRKVKLTHAPQVVLDIDGDVTAIEYQLEPGVTASLTPLVREP
jgi:hypothetical protein